MEILIGLGAGIAAAVLCAVFYRKGVKDGMLFKKAEADTAQEEAGTDSELMRKYELIMGYDPYGERV
jgi:hypothetical protein